MTAFTIQRLNTTILGLVVFLSGHVDAVAQTWPVSNPAYHTGFPVALPLADGYSLGGGIALADLNGDGKPEIIFGTNNGTVEAYTSAGAKLWSRNLGPTAISSAPAVADIDGDGFPEVVVSVGSTFTANTSGGVYVLDHLGNIKHSFPVSAGVFSTPALAPLNPARPGKLNIVFGTWDEHVRALNDDCSVYWDKTIADHVDDTVWSSPAIGDIDGDGQLEVAIGGDSNVNANPLQPNGGVLHVFRHDGSAELPGFPIYVDETISSSPVLVNLDNDPQLEIVVGAGECWEISACVGQTNRHVVSDKLYAFKYTGATVAGWPVCLDTPSSSSCNTTATGTVRRFSFFPPVVADLDGNGNPSIVVSATQKNIDASGVDQAQMSPANSSVGWLLVINANGTFRTGWPVQPNVPYNCNQDPNDVVHYAVGSPIVADLDGDGVPEILGTSNSELVVWGRDASQQSRKILNCPTPSATPGYQLGTNSFGNSGVPALGDLAGNGHLQLVETGLTPGTGPFTSNPAQGAIYVWDFPGSASKATTQWPAFRNVQTNTAVWRPDVIFANGFGS